MTSAVDAPDGARPSAAPSPSALAKAEAFGRPPASSAATFGSSLANCSTGPGPAAALLQLQRLVSGLNSGLDLEQTLTAVVGCVVTGLGFGVAVISVVEPDGGLRVAAVAGDATARQALQDQRSTRAEWDRLLALGEPVGPGRLLRLVDHRQDGAWDDDAMPTWVPESVAVDRPAGDERVTWHPLDALFAPLTSASAGLLGVLSVDMPLHGLRPGDDQLGLLEMFVLHAATAVEHARLHGQVLAAQELARTALAARLRAVVDASPAALVELDRGGRVREWNRAAEQLFGYCAQDLLDRPLPRLTDRDLDVPRLLARLTAADRLPTVQLRCRRRDGVEIDVELSAAATRGPDGTVHGVMGLLVDVTERVRLQHQLRHQATHDALTGLPNRLLITEQLRQALDGAQGCTGVLLIDLDRFKEVNDTLGHHHGDLLLAAIGPRLSRVLRPGDLLGRLSGDEFAVLLPHVADQQAATAVATRVLEALHEPFDLDGVAVDVEASIGLALAPADGTGPEQLMRHADVAMYEAKELSAGVVAYRHDRDNRAPSRLALLGDLRRALDGDELVVHYQPQIDMVSRRLCGLEALVRWQHPQRGLLAPDQFLPVAETTGLINRLTLRVLDLVLAQTRRWHDEQHAVPVAVNLSARCLHDQRLPDIVRAALTRHGVPAHLLRLEITESAIMGEPARALDILRRLSASGVRLSLDDFGTGYSSMSYLRELPVDELKVDRSFVTDMTGDAKDHLLVRSAVELGHNLGLSVVAEGVEDEPTLHALTDLGCDIAQGYLLARPMSAAALETWRGQHQG